MNETEYKKLKAKAEKAEREAQQAEGRYQAAVDRLTHEFGIESIEDAEAALDKLEADAIEADAEYSKAVAVFEVTSVKNVTSKAIINMKSHTGRPLSDSRF